MMNWSAPARRPSPPFRNPPAWTMTTRSGKNSSNHSTRTAARRRTYLSAKSAGSMAGIRIAIEISSLRKRLIFRVPAAAQVGDQVQDLLLREVIHQSLRHHRHLRDASALDVFFRDLHRFQ